MLGYVGPIVVRDREAQSGYNACRSYESRSSSLDPRFVEVMPTRIPRNQKLIGEPRFLSMALAVLVGGGFVGIVVLIAMKLRAWYREDSDDEGVRDRMLLEMHELKRQGGLTEDEYRSIRGRLAAKPAASSSNGTESVESAGTAPTTSESSQTDSEPRNGLADETAS